MIDIDWEMAGWNGVLEASLHVWWWRQEDHCQRVAEGA